ncbi:OST1 [Candida oxycetoniae]|uniref:Dolichyl-diphosphooligosaccharide--protein glycosyltransferase subunit 1 n=1 Tax=Candida oxycetoniae TaxID=497107 RepID=A0AAI9SU61_9ASCO|nr:OST1 [Candida oxycetoniae]KAI3402564.2 OST1 [Candida oxycetoniae]
MWLSPQFMLTIGVLLCMCNAHISSLYTLDLNWENSHYTRTIDLAKSSIAEVDLISIKNTAHTPQSEYYYTINDGFDSVGELSSFSVRLADQSVDVPFEEITANKVFKFNLPVPVAPNSDIDLKVSYVYIDCLEPVPKKIRLEDVQQLLYQTNKFPFSPYVTKDYTLIFTGMTKGQEMELHLDKAVNATNPVPYLEPRVENRALKYGPFVEDIAPFTLKPMGLMYDHNRPLLNVISLNRSVWLPASQVNKVSIEEYYELTNSGAELSSGFSRVDWMKGRYAGTRNHWALSHLEFPLWKRKEFEDYYFTDKAGVVSTHKVVQNHLLLSPRFPIFGGWHYNFTLGWTEDMSQIVHQSNQDTNEYLIRLPILNTLRDVTYEDVYLEFYLPENSQYEDLASSIPYESITVTNELSYFDVSKGHIKVTVHYRKLYDSINQVDVILKYKYSKTSLYTKVGKISAFIFTGLISYYLLNIL